MKLNLRPNLPLLLGITLSAILLSCGRSGGSSGSDLPPKVPPPPAAALSGPSSFSGKVVLGELFEAADGFEVWLLNHSESGLSVKPIDGSGAFVFPLTEFKENSIYSIEIVDGDGISLGAVDFSSKIPGIQSGFTYIAGGFGVDIGTIKISENYGQINRTSQTLVASLSGGFNPRSGVYSLLTFPTHSQLSIVAMGSQLNVVNPTVILDHFYQKANNPLEYGRSLTALSGIYFRVTASGETKINEVSIGGLKSWSSGAQIYGLDESSLSSWVRTGEKLLPNADLGHTAKIIADYNIRPGLTAVADVYLANGARVYSPFLLKYGVSMIPVVEKIALNGNSAGVLIDYSSDTSENGLTRPFKWTSGDIVATIKSPLDSLLVPIRSDVMGSIEMKYEYYIVNSDGSLSASDFGVDDFVAPFDRTSIVLENSQMKESWNAQEAQMSIALEPSTTSSLDAIPLNIYGLALGLSSNKVDRTRVRIIYHDSVSHAETVLWFRR